MTPRPRVSVVIPVYNAERYLRQAMDSVLAQTYSDFELVVIDDGSSDGSAAVAASYTDPRVRLVRHPVNRGLAAVRNTALDEVQGEFLAWLDADDVSLPGRLEAQLALLDADESLALCGTWVRTIGALETEWQYPTESDVLRARLLFDDPFANSSIVIRRRCVTELGLRFDPACPPAEDYDVIEKLASRYRVANVPEVLTHYRLHDMQTSKVASANHLAAIWRVQQRQLARLGIEATDEERLLHLDIGFGWRFDGRRETVRRAQAWLERLARANAATSIFPEPAFRRVLAERWFHVCYAATGGGMFAWSIFNASPLGRHASVIASTKAKFLARALLRIPRTGRRPAQRSPEADPAT